MTSRYVLIWLATPLVVLGALGCGEDPRSQSHKGAPAGRASTVRDKGGAFERLIDHLDTYSRGERLHLYAALATGLRAGTKQGRGSMTVYGLVSSLVRRGEFELIVMLDSYLRTLDDRNAGARAEIARAVCTLAGESEVRDLLAKLAAQNPRSIPLARYREGGVEYLLGVLEEPGVTDGQFFSACRQLAAAGGASNAERLRKLLVLEREWTDPRIAFQLKDKQPRDLVAETIESIEASGRP